MEHCWCKELYDESFAGILDSYQRRELRLPRMSSLAEVTYPQLHLATLTLGIGADYFQGGEEMRGYLVIMESIAQAFTDGALRAPQFLPGNTTFLMGTDGRHMASENALYLSASDDETAADLAKVSSVDILAQWAEALGAKFTNQELNIRSARENITSLLNEQLGRFRTAMIANDEVANVLERSALAARERLRTTAIKLKQKFGIPGYAAAS